MKVTKYNISVTEAYIGCDDVPSSACCEVSCNECPFVGQDVTLEEVLKKYIEVYNADN